MSLRLQHTLGCALVGFGGLIYLAFRPTTILLFHIADGMGLMPLIAQWRSLMATWQPSEFWVYSLPGGLWASAYILLVYGLLERQSMLCYAAPLGLLYMFEIIKNKRICHGWIASTVSN